MSQASSSDLDIEIQNHCTEGNVDRAATRVIEGYGPEIFGFIMNILRDEVAAQEAFSQFCEDMWRGLAGFRWQSSLRTWLYTIARNATSRWQRSPHRRRERNVALSVAPAVAEAEVRVRTRTLPHLRTEIKDRFTSLREALSESDRTLLALRVDRRMAWKDIAEVMAKADTPTAGLKKEAARQRKRFQLLKEKLRDLASKEGLLDLG